MTNRAIVLVFQVLSLGVQRVRYHRARLVEDIFAMTRCLAVRTSHSLWCVCRLQRPQYNVPLQEQSLDWLRCPVYESYYRNAIRDRPAQSHFAHAVSIGCVCYAGSGSGLPTELSLWMSGLFVALKTYQYLFICDDVNPSLPLECLLERMRDLGNPLRGNACPAAN